MLDYDHITVLIQASKFMYYYIVVPCLLRLVMSIEISNWSEWSTIQGVLNRASNFDILT